jgi:hypothetical protein
MELSREDYAVGESAVEAEVERWRPEYLSQKNQSGYKTRAEREA